MVWHEDRAATLQKIDMDIDANGFNDECEYQIVGSPEANVKKGLISDESPVGKALLGHKVGEEITAEAPSGNIVFKILEIK